MKRSLACYLAVSTGIVGGVGSPPAQANSSGPFPGFSGGPTASGQSCTYCHGYDSGPGYTRIVGLPDAYVPGAIYDLAVRVADADQEGAGFELSVEAAGQFVGTLIVTDPVHTQLVDDGAHVYVAHTLDGVNDSVANWQQMGGMVDFQFSWQAPAQDVGPIGFYAAGNAVNRNHTTSGDVIYLATVFLEPLVDGDGDDDGDADFADFSRLQECFEATPLSDACALFDLDGGGTVNLDDYANYLAVLTGPTALGPSAYRHANPARGAKLYDRWWRVIAAPEPIGEHPLYPDVGQQTGSTTFRCKECHGWDYKGVDGAYGTGSHFTGIAGVLETGLTTQQIFDIIKEDAPPSGHGMAALGLTDADIWDLTRFIREYLVDTDDYIDPSGAFTGNAAIGMTTYLLTCSSCHGDDGQAINFGSPQEPEYLGTLANDNPWEFLHKVRGGQPARPMPAFIDLAWPTQSATDVGAYAATLPPG